MGCFLADRTFTLHDLANNGLLQLDQIRVYNPLSIFANRTSTDDHDVEKETEEDFLEEIDPSSRRSSNKSNEQLPLIKRFADTPSTTKQTKVTKSISNENQRKSSLIIESNSDVKEKKTTSSREQRRQTPTTNNGSPSLRSAKQTTTTTTKKTSKCKKISLRRRKFIFFR